MGFFDDLGGSMEALASFPELLYNLFLAGGIVVLSVVAFVGLAMGVGYMRNPADISLSAAI